MDADLPAPGEIAAAAAGLRGVVHRTPLLSSRSLGERVGAPVFLKCENLQRAGSFKIRGAYTKIASLSAAERARGVITYSSGNHAQGVALAAQLLGVQATVVMPEDVVPLKRAAAVGYGAAVELAGFTSADRRARAEALAVETGAVIIPPFDDRQILAGQATIGREIAEDCPAVAHVLVPVGGGGCCGGIALALREWAPQAQVWAVEPEGADALARSLEAGALSPIERPDTIADGLRPLAPGVRNLAAAVACGVKPLRVTDRAIRDGMRVLANRARLVVEPSGAAAVAALLSGAARVAGDAPVTAVLTGGNVDPAMLAGVLGDG